MKSRLSAALVAGACVLAVSSPANAITVTLNLGATTSSVPGAVLFNDFDTVNNTSIGTITGGVLCSGVPGCGGFGTPPATGKFLGVFSSDGTTTIATVTFKNPVSYAGFAWGTPDPGNEVDVYNGSTLLGSFLGTTNVGPYYFNIFAGPGQAITKVVLSSGCCFETDNFSAIPGLPTPIPGVGLPGLALILAGGLLWRRRQTSS